MEAKSKDEIIKFLWNIIDDIDTSSDMCKEDHKSYRKIVNDFANKRFKIGIECDGYNIDYSIIYKKCIFEKFLNNECIVIATNIRSGYSWAIEEHEVDILEHMITNKNFDLFPIPKCFIDNEIIIKIKK